MFNDDLNKGMLTEKETKEIDDISMAMDDYDYIRGMSKCFIPFGITTGIGCVVGGSSEQEILKIGITSLIVGLLSIGGYFYSNKKYKVLSAKHSVYKQQLIDKYGKELVKTPFI